MKKGNVEAVMLIDDFEVDNFIHRKLLEQAGVKRIFVHSSAKSALEHFENLHQIEEGSAELMPEWIFLNLNMPLLDGFGFLENIQGLFPDSDFKIAVLTASVNREDEVRARSFKNVKAYLHKPLSEDVIAEILNN